ncbi:DUF6903 family protein [Enterococcus dispar]|jgi:hypothetical protein|uniref:Uncharacterized protein n=2 Tax=Enterococcus TaxID=1350 RepID=S0K8D2_9ENTE|nr:hypothetical protein [Enterococcus dispar]EOT41189.1 hypothetical protein OMK_01358 [Enterococcus dispar ATCC 51266]EOW87177.1 hypothetical protein I569_02548 [Enterococcus dispar ATCC 51266]MCU7356495.1 hypothetical protein [Enterococcus dispar]MDT2704465.1 hypothetical protein [Enterococcus dispar]WCG33779.1 hypothetical protein PML78_03545 [Enterococcus dispar]
MNKAKYWFQVAVFIICFLLIIYGQKNIGYTGLALQLLGLVGLLSLLWRYNKNYQ